jgi:hypothetical protein
MVFVSTRDLTSLYSLCLCGEEFYHRDTEDTEKTRDDKAATFNERNRSQRIQVNNRPTRCPARRLAAVVRTSYQLTGT